MSEKPILACKRCKIKKLKCDNEPQACGNCIKAGGSCLQVDSRSGKEYPRGYVEVLLGRIRHLKQTLDEESRDNSSITVCESSPLPTASERHSSRAAQGSTAPNAYRGVGSVTDMARLVEAAVMPTVPCLPQSAAVLYGPSTGNNSEDHAQLQAVPAELPSRETSRQLFASYLNGMHLLHPFLQRAKILGELDDAYQNPHTQTSPDLFRINMILAIGAVSLVRSGAHSVPPIDYYVAAMRHANKISFGFRGTEQIQALMLVLLFSLQHDVGVGNRWDLSHVAIRACIENNFHRSSYSLPPMEEQMRRRIFWACYINDRHSSSVLGRPMAIQDEEIDIELPFDADDDLIESGNTKSQFLRGMSEVSAQLRQISLMKITARIGTQLYRRSASQDKSGNELQAVAADILSELDRWQADFPVIWEARNAYETLPWRDLNYARESLKCYRLLAVTRRAPFDDGAGPSLFAENTSLCIRSAARVASSYRALRTADKLILNWTCVHDMLSAGFTLLYCGILRHQAACGHGGGGGALAANASEDAPPPADATMTTALGSIIETLTYVADRWPGTKQHLHAFKTLTERVLNSVTTMPARAQHTGPEVEPTTTAPATIIGVTFPGAATTAGHENSAHAGTSVDLWDTAVAAFLDEPLDMGNVDWGAIDWGATDWDQDALQQPALG